MNGERATPEREIHYAAVRRVLARVLLANLAVTAVKILLGLYTGSLAVVADGFHSLVDSSSNLIGLAALRLAERPADERHPYGYRRYETVGAFAIGVMLLGAALEIGRAILSRLSGAPPPEISPVALLVLALTLPVNVLIAVQESRRGRQLGSELLLADAAHTRTDLLVTLSVLVSLAGGLYGLPWLDLAVAGVVVVLILRASFGILRDAAGWLADATIADPERVEAIARSVPGVMYVHRIRSRGTPDEGFVDLHVKVNPEMSTSQAHAIASSVEERLKGEIPQVVDALVHIEPGRPEEANDWESIAFRLRQIAEGMGLSLHDLHVHVESGGTYAIELHLEIPGDLPLGEAHALAERFEAQVRARWPRARRITTHLEPLPASLLESRVPDGSLEGEVEQALFAEVGEENVLSWHLRRLGDHNSLAVRVAMPEKLSLSQAHVRVESLERILLDRLPALRRITIHVEPRSS